MQFGDGCYSFKENFKQINAIIYFFFSFNPLAPNEWMNEREET
jgi:hypothetical protein